MYHAKLRCLNERHSHATAVTRGPGTARFLCCPEDDKRSRDSEVEMPNEVSHWGKCFHKYFKEKWNIKVAVKM